jgi:hypothetical protein
MADALRYCQRASGLAAEGPVSCPRKQKTTRGQEMLTRIFQAAAILLAGTATPAAQVIVDNKIEVN